QGHDRAHGAREGRRDLHPLPARRSRLRGRLRGDRRPAERDLGRGGEPPARAEGAPRLAAAPAGGVVAERRGREPGIDLARGLAVFGMFAAHLLVTAPCFSWSDPGTWTAAVHGNSSILFATLAGVSL